MYTFFFLNQDKLWKQMLDACLNAQGEGDFPGSPVVKYTHFHCTDGGLIPGWGTKISNVMWYSQKKKKHEGF